jgi:8-oxo-dGTP pyrophosphatase MutT (NUDIX family)
VPGPSDHGPSGPPRDRSMAGRLAGYRPEGAAETADVARLRELLTRTDDPWPRTLPLHVTASALIVHPASGRVLLRWHQRQQAWLHVGGHGDPGEADPLAIALREADEETGLADLVPWPDDQIRQVAIVSVPASRQEPAHEHADVRFALATADPGAARPESPDAPVRWVSVPEAASTPEANMREAWLRVQALLDAAGRPAG